LRWEFPNPSQEDRRSCATSKTFNTKRAQIIQRETKKKKTHNINTNNSSSSSRRHTPKHKPFLMQKKLWKKQGNHPRKAHSKANGKKNRKEEEEVAALN
jgi:hypothetical protein